MSIASANDAGYKEYNNELLGVSFKYPEWARIDDRGGSRFVNVEVRIEHKPENRNADGSNPYTPVFGVTLRTEDEGDFRKYINKERQLQVEEGYRSEVTERIHQINNFVAGIEFVRDSEDLGARLHYFVFPTLRENLIMTLEHYEGTGQSSTRLQQDEADALEEYRRIRNSLNVIR